MKPSTIPPCRDKHLSLYVNIIPSIFLCLQTEGTKYRQTSWGWIVLSISSHCKRKPRISQMWLSICVGLLNCQIAFRTAIPFELYHDMQNMQGTYYHKNRDDETGIRGADVLARADLGLWVMLQHGMCSSSVRGSKIWQPKICHFGTLTILGFSHLEKK